VRVGLVTTQWMEERPGSAREWVPAAAPTAAVDRISLRLHGWGALEGLGLGLLSGALAGALIGAAWASSQTVVTMWDFFAIPDSAQPSESS